MKGSQVHHLYRNSNFKNFNDYTLPFWIKNVPNIAHAHGPESQIFANLDFLAYLEHLK